MLPKHMFDAPPAHIADAFAEHLTGEALEEALRRRHDMAQRVRDKCPRSTADAGRVLRAVITQGLGWGASKPFVLGMLSWSAGPCLSMLAAAAHESNGSFRQSVDGCFIMYPAYYDVDFIQDALKGIPTIMYVFVCTLLYFHINACIYIYIYMCVYVCMYVWTLLIEAMSVFSEY